MTRRTNVQGPQNPDDAMSSVRPAGAETVSLATKCGRLNVEFRWLADRFAQRLVDEHGHVLGESIEGDDSDVWPPSPPLQQLSRESVNDDHVILGVGAAGKSHWSISVEVVASDSGEGLKYDLACRCKSPPSWLGSSYRLDPTLRLTVLENSVLCQDDHCHRVTPPSLSDEKTYRWAYFFELCSSSDTCFQP